MTTRRTTTLAAALTVALLVTGCSDSSPAEAGTSVRATATSTGTATASSAGSSAPVAGTTGRSSATSAAAAGVAYRKPRACDGIALQSGARIPAAKLAGCINAAMTAWGSGRETFAAGDRRGSAEFTYGRTPTMAGQSTGSDGTVKFRFLPKAAWITSRGRWVRADPRSSDPTALAAAAAASLYRVYAAPAETVQVLAAAPSWKPAPQQDVVRLPRGEVKAWRIAATGPFTVNLLGPQRVNAYTVWVKNDFTPVGVRGTVTSRGVRSTTTQYFYDLGKPVVVTAPK